MSEPPKGIDPKVWEMAIALADIWQAPMHHDYQIFAEDVAGAILKAKNDAYEEAIAYHHERAAEHEAFRFDAKGVGIEHHGKMVRLHQSFAQAIRNLKHETEV